VSSSSSSSLPSFSTPPPLSLTNSSVSSSSSSVLGTLLDGGRTDTRPLSNPMLDSPSFSSAASSYPPVPSSSFSSLPVDDSRCSFPLDPSATPASSSPVGAPSGIPTITADENGISINGKRYVVVKISPSRKPEKVDTGDEGIKRNILSLNNLFADAVRYAAGRREIQSSRLDITKFQWTVDYTGIGPVNVDRVAIADELSEIVLCDYKRVPGVPAENITNVQNKDGCHSIDALFSQIIFLEKGLYTLTFPGGSATNPSDTEHLRRTTVRLLKEDMDSYGEMNEDIPSREELLNNPKLFQQLIDDSLTAEDQNLFYKNILLHARIAEINGEKLNKSEIDLAKGIIESSERKEKEAIIDDFYVICLCRLLAQKDAFQKGKVTKNTDSYKQCCKQLNLNPEQVGLVDYVNNCAKQLNVIQDDESESSKSDVDPSSTHAALPSATASSSSSSSSSAAAPAPATTSETRRWWQILKW